MTLRLSIVALLSTLALLSPSRAWAQPEVVAPAPTAAEVGETADTIDDATPAPRGGSLDPAPEDVLEGDHEAADDVLEGDEGEAPDDAPEPVDGDDVEAAEDAGEPQSPEDVVEQIGEAIGEIGSSIGRAQRPDARLRWDATWPRYRFDELVVTLGMGLVIVIEELLPTRTDPNWQAVTTPELEVARAMGLNDPFARDVLDEVSSGLVTALVLWPVALDSLVFAGLGEGAWDVAWQLSLISLEVFAVNQAIGVLVRLLTRRERPLGNFCREEPGYDADPICRDQPAAESFWSSHTSNAFAGAALVCMHHDVLDLFGDEVADGVACGTALAAAATTGVMRILSDQNWITDVLTGAALGSLSGILIPWILHFQGGARPPLPGADPPVITFMPMIGEDVVGLGASGRW